VGCHRLAPSPVFRFGSLRLGSGRVHRHSSRVPCPRVIINRLPRRVLPCGLLHHSRCTGISIDVARRFSVGGLIPVSLTTRNERSDSWKCLRRRSEEPTLLSWSPIRSLVKSQGCGEARGGAGRRLRPSTPIFGSSESADLGSARVPNSPTSRRTGHPLRCHRTGHRLFRRANQQSVRDAFRKLGLVLEGDSMGRYNLAQKRTNTSGGASSSVRVPVRR